MASPRRNPRFATFDGEEPPTGFLARFEHWMLAGASREQLNDISHRERLRNVGIGILVASFGFVAEAIEGLRIGVPVVTISGVLVLAVFVSTLFFLRKSQRFVLAGHLVLTGVLMATSINLLFAGGFLNPAIVSLFILPIGAAILIDVWASVVWGAIALAVFTFFWIAPQAGLHMGTVPGGIDSVNSLVNRGIVLSGIVVLISLFVAGRKQADGRLRTAIERLRAQAEHLELLNESAVAANESGSLQEAMTKCIASICDIKDWPLALAYDLSASGELAERAVLYSAPSVAGSERRLVRESFQLLVDLPTQATGAPKNRYPSVHWDHDLSASDNPYRRVLAQRLGLQARVQAVVDIGDQEWILEFFSESKLHPEYAFVETLASIGTQLERVLERSRAHSRIHDLSYTDGLTRLSNRRHLNEAIETILKASPDGEHVAILQIGLDRFKTINDALGHEIGDALLHSVASHLLGSVAELANDENTGWKARECVFRSGGDEFAVVLTGIAVPANSYRFARHILDRISEPVQIGEHEIHSRASVGIGISTLDASTGSALLQCAGSALAAAKTSGGAQIRHYAVALNKESNRRLYLENRLRRAIELDELELVYQPLMLADASSMAGVEALLRWTTGDGDRISPVDFIPVAETTGQIGSIGRWVLETACKQLSSWIRNQSGPQRVAVNVSVVQLREDDFVEFVVGQIKHYALPQGSLELEITESRLIGSEPEVLARLEELRSIGAKLSLDDFGTGYSSLSQLKRLPIAKLKIDRSFVDGIENDSSNMSLVEAIVQIGRNLNLRIVAEGVETQEQADILCNLGADELQGYFFSRPVAPAEIEQLPQLLSRHEPEAVEPAA
tara:strand:- start:7458 stop:10010 length:2553 start_codon:yes stop_codon:yes gene_type:complete